MRTTITLDDGLGGKLQDRMRRTGKSFNQTLVEVLAAGLAREKSLRAKPFKVKASPMGLRPGIDPARLHELETDLEIDRFLRVAERKP